MAEPATISLSDEPDALVLKPEGRWLVTTATDVDKRLRALPSPFDWSRCALCDPVPEEFVDPPAGPTAPHRAQPPAGASRSDSRTTPLSS